MIKVDNQIVFSNIKLAMFRPRSFYCDMEQLASADAVYSVILSVYSFA